MDCIEGPAADGQEEKSLHALSSASLSSKSFVPEFLLLMAEAEPVSPQLTRLHRLCKAACPGMCCKLSSLHSLHLQLPTAEEILAHLSGRRLSVLVFFLDETFEEITYDITTTVSARHLLGQGTYHYCPPKMQAPGWNFHCGEGPCMAIC